MVVNSAESPYLSLDRLKGESAERKPLFLHFLQQLELFPFNTSKEFDGDCSFCRGVAIQPMVVTDAERFFPQYAQNSHD